MAEQPNNEITTEKLLKALKINVARKIQAGEVGLVSEIERIEELEKRLKRKATLQAAHQTTEAASEEEEEGIPANYRIKRKYTMSEAARRQRQMAAISPAKHEAHKNNSNAWKTGQYARSFIRKIFKPCKSTCENYPCHLIDDGETRPGSLCLDKEDFVRNLQAIEKAMSGDIDDFKSLAALKIAGGMDVVKELLIDIMRDGTLLKFEKLDRDGNLVGFDIKNHPSLFALAKMLETMSLTPNDFMITPKAIAKQEDEEEGIKSIADLMAKLGNMVKGGKTKQADD